MSFNAAFSISQGVDVSSFTITDTSTGSDTNLTGRTISLYKADGTLLSGATISWPLSGGSSKTLTGVLDKDYDLNIVVVWASSSPLPSPSTYTANAVTLFKGYSLQFENSLIGALASNPNIENDQTFMENLGKVQTFIDCAIQANAVGEQGSSQNALDKINYIIQKQTFFF